MMISGCWIEEAFWHNFLPCVCRWWASSVTPAAFPLSLSTTSPFHHCTAPWTPLHPTPFQPAAASVQLSPLLRQWTAFHPLSPTVPQHTAPLATTLIPLWLLPAISTVSMAKVSLIHVSLLSWLTNIFVISLVVIWLLFIYSFILHFSDSLTLKHSLLSLAEIAEV